MNEIDKIPQDILQKMNFLDNHYPFRIIYACCKDDRWDAFAVKSMQKPKRLVREGYKVFILKKQIQQ